VTRLGRDALEEILAGARAAAAEAGELVCRGYRRAPVVEHKGAVDLVTEFDRDSETLLRDRLSRFGHAIVGEEQGGARSASGPTFFIDPIDGTTNFVHGHPFWCVSIGLVVEGEPALGVVLAPSLGLEWYGLVAPDGTRIARRRAWGNACNTHGGSNTGNAERVEDCAVSGVSRLEDSLLATGFPYDRRTSSENNFDAFVAIKMRCQAVRRCGSAALDLCLVADGTYDGYWERKLKPWDIAGGIALVRGAGGRVSEFDVGPESPGCIVSGHVVATNGLVHEALLAELANVSPRSR